jgi:hypothetical protein
MLLRSFLSILEKSHFRCIFVTRFCFLFQENKLYLRCDNNLKFQHGRQRKQRYTKVAYQDQAQGDEERVSVYLFGLLPRWSPQLRVPETLPCTGDG